MRLEKPVSNFRRFLPILVLGLLSRPLAAADATALDGIFAGKQPEETASLLVVLRQQADLSGAASISNREDRRRFVYEALRTTADATQTPLLGRLERAGARFQSFYLVNMIAVEADRPLAESIASRNDVALIAPNRPAHLALPQKQQPEVSPLSATAIEASLEVVHATAVWNLGFTGQGVVVGIADTGVDWEHPALKNRYRGFDGTSVALVQLARFDPHGEPGKPVRNGFAGPL